MNLKIGVYVAFINVDTELNEIYMKPPCGNCVIDLKIEL